MLSQHNPRLSPYVWFDHALCKHATPPYLRVNKETWLAARALPNFAIMKPRNATLVAAAWNHVNYRAQFPFEYEDAVNGGIVFG